MIYENWKELKPLTEPVPVGTKCVCLVTSGRLQSGDIVITTECDTCPECVRDDGIIHPMSLHELALLPSEEPAKVERKIVYAFECKGYVHAVCSDGTLWSYGVKWHQLPPIPKDVA